MRLLAALPGVWFAGIVAFRMYDWYPNLHPIDWWICGGIIVMCCVLSWTGWQIFKD